MYILITVTHLDSIGDFGFVIFAIKFQILFIIWSVPFGGAQIQFHHLTYIYSQSNTMKRGK